MITASDDRMAVRVGTLDRDGSIGDLRRVHDSHAGLENLAITADGSLAAFSSGHRSTGLEFSVLTIDVETGDLGPELWDGPGTSIVASAVRADDRPSSGGHDQRLRA